MIKTELLTNAMDHAALPRLFKKYGMKVVRKDNTIFLEGNTDALYCYAFKEDVEEFGFNVRNLHIQNGWRNSIVILEKT